MIIYTTPPRRRLGSLGLALSLIALMACSGGGDSSSSGGPNPANATSSQETCTKVDSLCTTSSGGDGGSSSVTVTKCDPNSFDKVSNDAEVKGCIDSASDCSAAIACLMKAKKK